MYASQKLHSTRRGHPQPTYTKEEFKTWVQKQTNWVVLFDTWESSGFKKDVAPSVDRFKSELPYSLDNIQLTTWKENKENYLVEKARRVEQYSVEGTLICTYPNIFIVAKQFGVTVFELRQSICKRYSLFVGFQWKFEGSGKKMGVIPDHYIFTVYSPQPIRRLSLEGGVLEEYSSLNKAALHFNKKTGCIRKVCDGIGKTCGGFKWEYTNEALRLKVVEVVKQRESKKIVEQYSLDGVFMREWASPLEIEKVLGVSVYASLEIENSTIGGYQWKYKNGCKVIKAKVLNVKKVGKFSLTGDFIETFVSSRDALASIEGTMKGLKKCLWGERKSYKGFIWRYTPAYANK